jgi:hypothetical protein
MQYTIIQYIIILYNTIIIQYTTIKIQYIIQYTILYTIIQYTVIHGRNAFKFEVV